MASPETFLDDPFNFTMEEVSALLNARKEVKEAFKLESRNSMKKLLIPYFLLIYNFYGINYSLFFQHSKHFFLLFFQKKF